MKKIFYLFLIVGLVATSCKKPTDIPTTQDVVFKATPAATGNFKEGDDDCVNPMAHYALIDIDGTMHTVDVFYLAGVIYTNTLKLAPGPHTVNSFVLMNDNGTPDDTSDDVMVQATPLVGSEYENFVEMPLPFEFTVDAFFKLEVNIEILCFVPNEYERFGFAWFTVQEIIVREVCFFGDIFTAEYLDYAGSLYELQENGLQHDMPAIFKIDVYRNGEWVISYDNEEWLGEGAPLCVKYPDFKNVEDLIEFKLSILVKVGEGFEYVEYDTYSTTDGTPLEELGDDNVVDFEVDVDAICIPLIDLGPYVILAKSGISSTGLTDITGDVGISPAPATAITGFDLVLSVGGDYSTSTLVDGFIYASDYAEPTPGNLTTAITNMTNAYTTLNNLFPPAFTEYASGSLAGQTLDPGIYKWSTGLLITTGITLDGGGDNCATWVFQIAGDLTVAPSAMINLTNGANAQNIYWVVAGSKADLDTSVDFSGNILSKELISMKAGASVTGRLLSQTAVTLIGNTVEFPE